MGIEKMCNRILKDVKDEILFLELMMIGQQPVGFINYQVDSKRIDWCEREGWGFIREMYMDKAFRNRNLGRVFVSSVLNTLKDNSIQEVYLTSDDSGEFFMKCGFTNSGCISKINEDPIYEIKI
ncbi:MAG: GNAT family N-acetyltransferase [Clostridia bacterium]|nr:GNAT family N-acetyltransferase [Clostridia bacterium]